MKITLLQLLNLQLKRGAKAIYFHAFLDGRDTPPRSAQASIERIEALFAELNCGRLASIVGRYYAMDRDNRWERVESAYNLMVCADG